MCCVSIIILTTLFAVTFSQLTISVDNSNVGAGETVVFTCTVTNFLDNVFVVQGTANRVVCIVGDSCATTDDSIYTVTTSGTTITFTINSFLKSRDVGSWVVRYGSTDSSPVTLSAAIESEVTTEGPIKGLETSTTFESSSIIEPSPTSIVVESNAEISWILPTDGSQLNTLDIFPFSSDFKIFSSSIVTSGSKHTSASFEKDNLETIDSTNASFFMHTTNSVPNGLFSRMSLLQTLDTYKTSIQSSIIETITISPLNVTSESDYQSTSSYFDAVSLFSETKIGLLTSGVHMTTTEISPGLIYSALDSSFFATTEFCPTNTFTETISYGMTTSTIAISTNLVSTENISTDMASTETISTGMTSTETISTDMASTETINTDMASPETVSTYMTSIETISTDKASTETVITGMTSTESVSTDMASTETVSTGMTSTETIITGMTSTETVSTSMTSTVTLSTGMTSTETVSTVMTSVYEMFDIVSELNDTTSMISITDANILTHYSLSDDIPVLQTTYNSFTTSGSPIHQSMEYAITSTAMSILFTSTSEGTGFSSSFTLEALRSSNIELTAVEYESQTSKWGYKSTSESQFSLSNSKFSGKSRTTLFKKADLSTSFSEQSGYVTHNSFLSSLTIFQTSSIRQNKTENASTERDSYIPTKLFSSMPDEITETYSSTYDDKFVLLTSTEHILLVTSSLNTLGSLSKGIEDSELITESFVKMISRSSNELATSSSSLNTFSPKYMKTTTAIQHGLSESSKDDIFISAAFGTIGAIILVVLIAMVISRYLMKRNKSKDDKISNQFGWSDDSGMNSYNKNYTSSEYPFNSSIHLPLQSYESPYFPYANYYKKNWDDNT